MGLQILGDMACLCPFWLWLYGKEQKLEKVSFIFNTSPRSFLIIQKLSSFTLMFEEMKIPGILTVWLSVQSFQVPGNLCNVTGSSRRETKQLCKTPWGIFVFGWLKCSELFKSWKRNNKPHPQRAPVWIPPLVYCFPIQNFSGLMRIKEPPQMWSYNLACPKYQTSKT